jgi:hypothetical protein
MKITKLLVLVLLIGIARAAAAARAGSAIAGTWQGKLDGLPAVILTVKNNGGRLSGVGVFYILRRNDGNRPKILGKTTMPLLDQRLRGNTFRLLVKRSDSSLTDFQMELTGKNEGQLTRIDPDGQISDAVTMVRAK